MAQDAIAVLIADHRKVLSLFEQMQSSPGERTTIQQIVRELSIHDAIERQLLYPLVKEKIPTIGGQLAERSLDEHEDQARLLADIEAADGSEQGRLLAELLRTVTEHVSEEEHQVFPNLRTVSTHSELLELGERLEDAKAKAPTHPHPHTPRSSGGAKAAGMIASATDKVRDSFGSSS